MIRGIGLLLEMSVGISLIENQFAEDGSCSEQDALVGMSKQARRVKCGVFE